MVSGRNRQIYRFARKTAEIGHFGLIRAISGGNWVGIKRARKSYIQVNLGGLHLYT